MFRYNPDFCTFVNEQFYFSRTAKNRHQSDCTSPALEPAGRFYLRDGESGYIEGTDVIYDFQDAQGDLAMPLPLLKNLRMIRLI